MSRLSVRFSQTGLFLGLLVLLCACLPTTEPAITPEKPPTLSPVLATEVDALTPSPSFSPAPTITFTVTPTMAATVTPTVIATATPLLEPTSEPTPAFPLIPGQIIYRWAEESEKYGWSVTGNGFVSTFLFDEKGEVVPNSLLLWRELPTGFGQLAPSPDGSRVIILDGAEGGYYMTTLYPSSGKTFIPPIGEMQFWGWHPDNQQVLIWIEVNARDVGLWLVNVDTGEHLALLTDRFIIDNRLGTIGSGAVSADGQTIVYTHEKTISSGEIWLMNSDGTNRRFLWESPTPPYAFQWSPDNKSIAFVGAVGPNAQDFGVIVMNADGSNPRVVSRKYSVGSAFPLAWSPDSQMLTFNGYCEGNPMVDASSAPYDFHNNTRIVNVNTGEDVPLLADGCGNTDAVWSPDGNYLTFVSVRSGQNEIWLADKKGGNLHQLTHSNGVLVRYPVWLPIETP